MKTVVFGVVVTAGVVVSAVTLAAMISILGAAGERRECSRRPRGLDSPPAKR